jgi:hypothetical protein
VAEPLAEFYPRWVTARAEPPPDEFEDFFSDNAIWSTAAS